MTEALLDFENRVAEIDKYFKFLVDLEQDPELYYSNKETHKIKPIDGDLLRILKASSFLILYNLCESSISNGVEAIINSINEEAAQYSHISDEIKAKWMDDNKKEFFKDVAGKIIVGTVNGISTRIVSMSFSPSSLSGNVDATSIYQLALSYGFSPKTHYSTKNGKQLNIVKKKRNHLAHGNMSFLECGRDYSVEDLGKIKRQVVTHLRGIMRNIEKYIANKAYLSAP